MGCTRMILVMRRWNIGTNSRIGVHVILIAEKLRFPLKSIVEHNLIDKKWYQSIQYEVIFSQSWIRLFWMKFHILIVDSYLRGRAWLNKTRNTSRGSRAFLLISTFHPSSRLIIFWSMLPANLTCWFSVRRGRPDWGFNSSRLVSIYFPMRNLKSTVVKANARDASVLLRQQ